MKTTSRLRWVVKYTASGPSPTCDDRSIDSPYEWGVLKTTAIQWTGWNEGEHKTLPVEFWGAKHLEIHKGDVLVTKAGPRQRVGVSAYVDKAQPRIIVSGKMILLRVDESVIDPRYLNWQLATPKPQAYLNACMTGMAEAQMNFANEDLLGMEIDLPSLDEQRRIADLLDAETARIDRLIELRTSQLESVGARMQSHLSKVAETLKDRHGTVKVRHVLQKIEQGWSPQCEDRLAAENEWGVVKAGCVNGGVFDATQHKALPVDTEPELRYRLHAGDLLMSRASGSVDLIGSIGVLPDDFSSQMLLCDKIYRLHMDRTRMMPRFVALMLGTHRVREKIKLGISGADGMANNLPTATVTNLPVPDVPLAGQACIVNDLNDRRNTAQDVKQMLVNQSTLLAERRQALITAAVTGQIDVTTARGLSSSGGAAV